MRVPARTYVEFFRDTPLLVQLLAIYWALIFLPPQILNAFTAGLATLVLNYAAYECENLRAGIEALDRGQGEAATALGMSYGQSLRLVIVPQMISIVLPPVINDLIYMYKDSAILSIISVTELTEQANDLARRFPALDWQFYLLAACAYLLLSLPLARVARVAEARLRSTTFVPRFDPVLTALAALLAVAVVGWICGVLVQGISAANVLGGLGQVLAGIALTLGITLFIMCTLGLIVYLLGGLFGLARRGGRRRQSFARRQPDEILTPVLLPK